MKDIKSLVRRDFKDIEPYTPSPLKEGAKLDANESPWNLPEGIRYKLIKWLEDGENLNRYPDTDNTSLRESIARYWKVKPSNVTCGVGSDQLIDMICRVFLNPGDCAATFEPTFGMYRVAVEMAHGRFLSFPIGYDEKAAEELARAANDAGAKIVFLCSPNNPTGRAMTDEAITAALEKTECLVVIDEAYADFGGPSFIKRVSQYPNAVILRTFSKAYGLAGIRVGYAIADELAIGLINMVKPPFNIPVISQLLAGWAMDEAAEYAVRVSRIISERDRLLGILSSLDWLDAEHSDANFVYVASRFDIAPILEAGGVNARDFGVRGNVRRVRITIGTEEENKKVGDLLCAARPK